MPITVRFAAPHPELENCKNPQSALGIYGISFLFSKARFQLKNKQNVCCNSSARKGKGIEKAGTFCVEPNPFTTTNCLNVLLCTNSDFLFAIFCLRYHGPTPEPCVPVLLQHCPLRARHVRDPIGHPGIPEHPGYDGDEESQAELGNSQPEATMGSPRVRHASGKFFGL